MKNYFYILLFFASISFGQTEFNAIKLKNDPVTVNDTTQVDLLVRQNEGIDKGMVRKVGWPYLVSALGINDIEECKAKDLPNDFFISMTWDSINMGRYITYKTDIYRRLDVLPYVNDSIYGMYGSPVIVGNNIFLQGQYFPEGSGPSNSHVNEGKGERFFLALYDCKIFGNELIVGSSATRIFNNLDTRPSNGVRYNLHYSDYSRGYMFYVSRAYETATQLFKINPYNISDFKVLTLPTGIGYGTSGAGKIYKDWIYLLGGTSTTAGSYIIRIHENLDTYESLFIVGNISGTKRVKQTSCFEIYNDEIYIPTVNNTSPPSAYDTIGLSVYSLEGILKREVSGVTISTAATGQPAPHWMTIFGGKVIMHTTGSPNSNKRLLRFDAYTLNLEESISLPCHITASNTIDSQGYVYLNPEIEAGQSLIKMFYMDFAGTYENINSNSPLYYYSIGSPKYYVNPEGLKTKLSQFKNDLNLGNGTVTNLSIVPANGVTGSVATSTTTPAITLSLGNITPTSIGSTTTVTTQSPNDNSTRIASTAYADAKVGDFINDGATILAPSQNAVFDALALKANFTNNTTIGFANNSGIRNTPNVNNFTLTVGSSLTSPVWTRNTADAITTAVFDNANASNTGQIVEFKSGGTTQVNITKAGNVYFPSSSDGIVLTSPDGTKYLITITNSGTLQSSTITTP